VIKLIRCKYHFQLNGALIAASITGILSVVCNCSLSSRSLSLSLSLSLSPLFEKIERAFPTEALDV